MLIDGFGREVNYLRISVTERCNFRCQYCMPEKPFSWVPKENIMSYEDMFKFVQVAIDNGVNKIRITGGEPLLREGLSDFIKMINDYKSDIDLALTTNGYLLPTVAKDLKDAGLKRVNISLDSLKPKVAHHIAQKDVLDTVLKGIEMANSVGLKIKINTVPMQDVNGDEIIDILEYCMERNYPVRFIEYMENSFANSSLKGFKSANLLDLISKKYNFKKVPRENSSPAQYYELDNGYRFGIIEPYGDDFCESCNRIRLTAEGFLIPCLYFEDALSIKESIENNDIDGACKILDTVLANKPEKNKWSTGEDGEVSSRAFYETGG
jgi:cyclic pyranopterin phosphate synthase